MLLFGCFPKRRERDVEKARQKDIDSQKEIKTFRDNYIFFILKHLLQLAVQNVWLGPAPGLVYILETEG